MHFREWCKSQAGKERRFLTLFSTGASLFFAGSGLMIYADTGITPSIEQELVTLTGLITGIIGGGLASIGYIILTLIRLFK